MVLTKHRDPDQTEQDIVLGTSRDAFSSTILVRMEARPSSKSAFAWSKNRSMGPVLIW